MENGFKQKPPIGILSKELWAEFNENKIYDNGGIHPDQITTLELQRLQELSATIRRYFDAGVTPEKEWLKEYAEFNIDQSWSHFKITNYIFTLN